MKKLNLMNVAALTCLVALVGCAAPVDQLAEKPYCHTDRGMHAYCTKEVAPNLKRDAESKQFVPVPDAFHRLCRSLLGRWAPSDGDLLQWW